VATSTGRTTVVVQPDDTLNIIDLLLVTDLEYRESAAALWAWQAGSLPHWRQAEAYPT
jgi:hypothetical protein